MKLLEYFSPDVLQDGSADIQELPIANLVELLEETLELGQEIAQRIGELDGDPDPVGQTRNG